MNTSRQLVLAALVMASVAAVVACGGGSSPAPGLTSTEPVAEVIREIDKVDQLILQYKTNAFGGETISAAEADRLSAIAGVAILPFRVLSGDAHVVKLAAKVTNQAAHDISGLLMRDPLLLFAGPDQLMVAHQAVTLPPTDPLFSSQWNYSPGAVEPGGANVAGAWSITTGQAPTVVAVIDTGVLQHPDLVGRILPGYDFISNGLNGDGNGRDADPTDPGDSHFALINSVSTFIPSSWHGTHISGIVGATANNSLGIAGVNWNTKILPIRALGKQGGNMSDVQDAIRWAVGLPIAGVPLNANPANVINLSIGSYWPFLPAGACSAPMQSAINAAIAKGATIVVSAGNENDLVAYSSPANCAGVISVGSIARNGDYASYSNYGPLLTLMAPGGSASGSKIKSTSDSGTTTAANDGAYKEAIGTSFSAPHVAGVVSLMYALAPTVRSADVIPIIKSSARAFPATSRCVTAPVLINNCGSGILDGGAALIAFKNSNAFCGAQNPPTC